MSEATQAIVETLEGLGFKLSAHVIDPGNYKTPSKFGFTVSRNGQSHTGEYTKGCAHRQWKKNALGHIAKANNAREGKGAVYMGGFLSIAREKELLDHTEPIPPTLDEVMWSLYMDASGVRHGETFAQWCDEYGYDTDSRKAEGIFNACRETWAALVRMGADFAELENLFANY